MEILTFIIELSLTVIIIPAILSIRENIRWKPTRTHILKLCIAYINSLTETCAESQKQLERNGLRTNSRFSNDEPIFNFEYAYQDWKESIQLYNSALTPELATALVNFQLNMLSLQREYQMFIGYLNRAGGYSGMVSDVIEPKFEDQASDLFSAIIEVANAVPSGKKLLLEKIDEERYKALIKKKIIGKFTFILQAIFKYKNLDDQLPHYYAIKESPRKAN
jgi:hypothetical protein